MLAAEKKGRKQPTCSCSLQASSTVLGLSLGHCTPRRFMERQLFTRRALNTFDTFSCM